MCQLIGLVDFNFDCSLTDIMLQLTNVGQTSELDHGEPKEWWIVSGEIDQNKTSEPAG